MEKAIKQNKTAYLVKGGEATVVVIMPPGGSLVS